MTRLEWRRRLAFTLLAYLAAVLALLIPECAQAEEPCVRDGSRVCCEAGAFTTLTDTVIELQAALERCRAEHALPAPVAPVCPVPPTATDPLLPPATSAVAPSATRPVAGLVTGVASTLVLVVAAMAPMDVETRASLGLVGLGGLGTAVFLVLP